MNTTKSNYSSLSLVQYLASFLVITIHTGQILPNELLHFIIKNYLARLAVPIFIIATAYFYQLKQTDQNYLKRYWLKLFQQYLLWSLIYLPLGLHYFFSEHYPIAYLPFALLLAFTYLGTYYHLWYYPALMFSLGFVSWLLSRYRWLVVGLLLAVLYAFGSLETYSGYLTNAYFEQFYQFTHDLFLTFRNGLFFSPVFVLAGMKLAEVKALPKQKQLNYRLILFGLLYSIEAYLIYLRPGDDKNFYLMLVPFSYFLTQKIITSSHLQFRVKTNLTLRQLAKINYLIHPLFIFLWLNSPLKDYLAQNGLALFLLTSLACLFSGGLNILFLKWRQLKVVKY